MMYRIVHFLYNFIICAKNIYIVFGTIITYKNVNIHCNCQCTTTYTILAGRKRNTKLQQKSHIHVHIIIEKGGIQVQFYIP